MTPDSEAERMRLLAYRYEKLAQNPNNSPGERDRLLHLAAQHREAEKLSEVA